METEITIVGHGANGAIRIAVLLPDSDRDTECYTHYHSGYYIAKETRDRLREALLANYGGYLLGDIINRDYGEGYTVYTIEITPKTPLETRARLAGHFPLADIGERLARPFLARFRRYADIPFTMISRLPCGEGISENNNK